MADSDADGLGDGYEALSRTDPPTKDTDGDGLTDAHGRNAVTDSSSPAQIRDTPDMEMLASTPSAATRSSITPSPGTRAIYDGVVALCTGAYCQLTTRPGRVGP